MDNRRFVWPAGRVSSLICRQADRVPVTRGRVCRRISRSPVVFAGVFRGSSQFKDALVCSAFSLQKIFSKRCLHMSAYIMESSINARLCTQHKEDAAVFVIFRVTHDFTSRFDIRRTTADLHRESAQRSRDSGLLLAFKRHHRI